MRTPSRRAPRCCPPPRGSANSSIPNRTARRVAFSSPTTVRTSITIRLIVHGEIFNPASGPIISGCWRRRPWLAPGRTWRPRLDRHGHAKLLRMVAPSGKSRTHGSASTRRSSSSITQKQEQGGEAAHVDVSRRRSKYSSDSGIFRTPKLPSTRPDRLRVLLFPNYGQRFRSGTISTPPWRSRLCVGASDGWKE